MKWFRFCIAALALGLCLHGFGNVFAANGEPRKTEIVKRDVRKLPDSELTGEQLQKRYPVDWFPNKYQKWEKMGIVRYEKERTQRYDVSRLIKELTLDEMKSLFLWRTPTLGKKDFYEDEYDYEYWGFNGRMSRVHAAIVEEVYSKLFEKPDDKQLSELKAFVYLREVLLLESNFADECKVPETLPFYRELILSKVRRSGTYLKRLSPKYRDDDEVVREAGSVYYASDRLKDDEAIVLFCTKKWVNETLGSKYFLRKENPKRAKYEEILEKLENASPRIKSKYKKMSQDELLKVFEPKEVIQ